MELSKLRWCFKRLILLGRDEMEMMNHGVFEPLFMVYIPIKTPRINHS